MNQITTRVNNYIWQNAYSHILIEIDTPTELRCGTCSIVSLWEQMDDFYVCLAQGSNNQSDKK